MKHEIKFEPTRIVGISRSVSGPSRGKYFCTALRPPKRITGHPGRPEFDAEVRRLLGTIKYSSSEDDEMASLTAWVAEAFRKIKGRSTERSIAFDLEVSDLHNIMKKQKYRCALTGAAFDFDIPEGLSRRPFAPSVDRIDSSQGYLASNVRITTVIANIARQDFGDEAFFQMCADAAFHKDLVATSKRGGDGTAVSAPDQQLRRES